jgi:hypothetical protein
VKHRLLIHAISYTWLVVDITTIGLPTEICPEEGEEQMVPSLRFRDWGHVERHADPELIKRSAAFLEKASVAVMTMVKSRQATKCDGLPHRAGHSQDSVHESSISVSLSWPRYIQ